MGGGGGQDQENFLAALIAYHANEHWHIMHTIKYIVVQYPMVTHIEYSKL